MGFRRINTQTFGSHVTTIFSNIFILNNIIFVTSYTFLQNELPHSQWVYYTFSFISLFQFYFWHIRRSKQSFIYTNPFSSFNFYQPKADLRILGFVWRWHYLSIIRIVWIIVSSFFFNITTIIIQNFFFL